MRKYLMSLSILGLLALSGCAHYGKRGECGCKQKACCDKGEGCGEGSCEMKK